MADQSRRRGAFVSCVAPALGREHTRGPDSEARAKPAGQQLPPRETGRVGKHGRDVRASDTAPEASGLAGRVEDGLTRVSSHVRRSRL